MSESSNALQVVQKWFTEYPESQGQTYCSYSLQTLKTAANKYVEATCLLVHAIFPALLQNTIKQSKKE